MERDDSTGTAANSGGYNFGTFGGVYTPALLTILGLVMFMRTNFVLGGAGLVNTLIILGAGASISLATTLSIAAIATNTEVKGGGAYYLISRVLGPSFGTSIGLTLFVSQSLAIPFNILGASEAMVTQWPELRPYFPLLNLALGAVLAFFVWKGADWAIRLQYVIMAVLGASVIVFLLGPIGDFSLENLAANLGPAEGAVSMIPFFAIFFPAVTGIMAGVNMSGDLKEPHRSIPRGTLAALGTAVALYLIQIVVAAGCFPRAEMIRTPYRILTANALWGLWFMVLAGVQAATLSTALGWLLGAPRVLQSLGVDNVLPGIRVFRKGSGPQNEPRRAIVVVVIIIAPILLWAGFLGRSESDVEHSPINLMSELVSLFFLFTYAIINIAAFVESHGANPSFRPRFRFFHWTVAVYGAAACSIAAFLIDLWLSVAAIVIIGGLYFWSRYRNLEMGYGDARRGYLYSRIRSMLLQLPRLPRHPKNWRPTIAILSEEPEKRGDLVEYAMLFSQRRGILSMIQIIELAKCREFGELRKRRLHELRDLCRERGWQVFPTVVVAPEFDVALHTVLQSHSLDPIRPNIIMMGWPHQKERVRPFFTHLQMIVNDFNRSALVLANASSAFIPQRFDGGTIDIWWQSQKGGSLITILAYLVQLDRGWRKSVLRIFLMDSRAEEKRIRQMLEKARISAEIVRIAPGTKLHVVLPRFSFNAELVFIEFPEYDARDGRRQMVNHYLIERELKKMPPCFLVVSNGEADLLA
ncbi:MAG: hypothetical protein HPZ91_13260 [Lentisphaeria bacterium]|nr:hypothetical protein [Lentisphaeria bacterium]